MTSTTSIQPALSTPRYALGSNEATGNLREHASTRHVVAADEGLLNLEELERAAANHTSATTVVMNASIELARIGIQHRKWARENRVETAQDQQEQAEVVEALNISAAHMSFGAKLSGAVGTLGASLLTLRVLGPSPKKIDVNQIAPLPKPAGASGAPVTAASRSLSANASSEQALAMRETQGAEQGRAVTEEARKLAKKIGLTRIEVFEKASNLAAGPVAMVAETTTAKANRMEACQRYLQLQADMAREAQDVAQGLVDSATNTAKQISNGDSAVKNQIIGT